MNSSRSMQDLAAQDDSISVEPESPLLPSDVGVHELLESGDMKHYALLFDTMLESAGLQAKDVLLLRHKDTKAAKGHSPYELWRDKPRHFKEYQSLQSVKARNRFSRPYWASFIVNAFDENVFAGIWKARRIGQVTEPRERRQHPGTFDPPNTLDEYDTVLTHRLRELIGKLTIGWGKGKLAWAQYAENPKPVLEIRATEDEPFPGFLQFIEPLSRIPLLPKTWVSALRGSRGIYLLACPKTREQYVGSASGNDGFYGRWMDYAADGHGGNVKLKSKKREDYQVSILEVAGSACDLHDLVTLEGRWQQKLQTTEMGLNSSLAKR